MANETAAHWDHAAFADFKPGDRIRFVTNDNGYGGLGEVWRTGTVRKVTAKTIAVDCDRDSLGNRAVIRLADWSHRCPMKIKPGHRVEIQPFVRSRESTFDRQDMFSIISEPDGAEIQKANLPSMARTLEDFEAELQLLGWELLEELTMVLGGYYQARVRRVAPLEREKDTADLATPEPEAQDASDSDVVRAFEAKADQVAADNGWTIARAETVMLRYLRDTAPAEAATIAAALQQRTKLCA